ncbi:MAG: ABC transporter ATP-binding protein [Micrococcales bacterium]|nr:ABC transporter ATP-binding protein [Micrococcales bacterium]
MTEQPVEIRDLRKRFGTVRALDGLDLVVEPGQVAGFLGPNGAGKSTTIRVLLGMLKPDSGTVRLLGGDPRRDAVALHQRLSYVPGEVALWPQLTGGETVDLLLGLRGVRTDPARRDRMMRRFELNPTTRVASYSKGNRQKIALVAALAADVDLLVLDEPTSGLDPLMAAVFEETVREHVARGTAVLLSSHVMAEVEALCDTVTIIRAGKAVQSGSLEQLRRLTRSAVTVHLTGDPAPLAALPGVHDLVRDGETVRFTVDDDATGEVTAALSTLGPRALTMAPPSLEEMFLREYGDELAALESDDEPATRRGSRR